jgi:hypothetical protein
MIDAAATADRNSGPRRGAMRPCAGDFRDDPAHVLWWGLTPP